MHLLEEWLVAIVYTCLPRSASSYIPRTEEVVQSDRCEDLKSVFLEGQVPQMETLLYAYIFYCLGKPGVV